MLIVTYILSTLENFRWTGSGQLLSKTEKNIIKERHSFHQVNFMVSNDNKRLLFKCLKLLLLSQLILKEIFFLCKFPYFSKYFKYSISRWWIKHSREWKSRKETLNPITIANRFFLIVNDGVQLKTVQVNYHIQCKGSHCSNKSRITSGIKNSCFSWKFCFCYNFVFT